MNLKCKRTLIPKLRFPEFREQWDEVRLSQLANSISDRVGTMPCIPYTVTSGLGLVSQEEKFGRTIAGNSLRNYIRLQKDDFAYNKSATKAYPEGYIARYLDEAKAAVPNSIFTCFRVDSEKVDPAYLDFLFAGNLHGRWLSKFLTIGARAHGSLNVSDDDLMALPVPLPSPPEQQKIAECLGSLNGVIAAEGRKLADLRDHKRGLMQQLFPQPGETQPRLRFPEFQDKGGWETLPLGRVVEIASGQVDPTESPYCDLPHVGGENIESHTGNIRDVKTAKELDLVSGKYAFDENDVLYSKIRPALNKVAAPDFRGICSADIYPIRPSNRELRREYLVYLLLSEGFLEHAIKHSDRSKIPKINRDTLLSYTISLPTSAEQQRIADCLTSLDTQITSQAAKIESLKQHKRGLMQQLFPAPEDL